MPEGERLAQRRDLRLDRRAFAREIIGDGAAEVRRMFVTAAVRRRGVARAVLVELERQAMLLGYRALRLQTGDRQPEAVALYAAAGYARIAPFGPYVDDATSVCFEKRFEVPPAAAHRTPAAR